MKTISLTNDVGKTVKSVTAISYTQLVIAFTDDTSLCVTARIDDGKPWIGTIIMEGHIEKEWQKEEQG
jgi:hypothetical protein